MQKSHTPDPLILLDSVCIFVKRNKAESIEEYYNSRKCCYCTVTVNVRNPHTN